MKLGNKFRQPTYRESRTCRQQGPRSGLSTSGAVVAPRHAASQRTKSLLNRHGAADTWPTEPTVIRASYRLPLCASTVAGTTSSCSAAQQKKHNERRCTAISVDPDTLCICTAARD